MEGWMCIVGIEVVDSYRLSQLGTMRGEAGETVKEMGFPNLFIVLPDHAHFSQCLRSPEIS